ncbi:MAG TPA: hypothetical protein VGU71_22275 [Candidatus Dormibacteraeota bacterium]|nr:hypothetical protein [Candidatus Dormibacteraeota bacterium]
MALDTTLPGSYISTQDFSQSNTGIDPSTMPAGELARFIFRASRRCDRVCKQVLYSTLDTVQLLEDRSPEGYSIDLSDGILKLFPKRFPIRSITSVTQQFSSSEAPAPIQSNWIHIDSGARWAWIEGTWSSFKRQLPPMYLVFTYVNGWMATTLRSQAASGQAVLNLVPQPGQTTVQGIYAGQALEIQDATPEVVQVLSVAGNAVTLTANLVSTHAADTFVVESSYNELSFSDVQLATLNFTAFFIKNKGIAPLVLKDERIEGQKISKSDFGLVEEAIDLLLPFTVQA